jgi:hypothetical protein
VLVRTTSFLRVIAKLEEQSGKVPMLRAYRLEPLVGHEEVTVPKGKMWG